MSAKLYECVPYDPVIRLSEFYDDKWKYLYRYEGNNDGVIDKMISCAADMAAHPQEFYYENPGFGYKGWCCVTVISYWVCYAGLSHKWIFGSSDQSYFWSPSYGGQYDKFLLDAGFKKYWYPGVGVLKSGDILQSDHHAAMVYLENGGDNMIPMPTLKLGSKGNVVKNLQALINLWTTQSGKYQPIKVDGIFGSETEQRLKIYQRAQGIVVDGIAAEQTWKDILLS